MKFALLVVLALLLTVNGNPFSRKCKCSAVSNTVHVPFHTWSVSSCKFCSCRNAAMTNCEQSCKAMVENYARSGCGKAVKGSKVKYSWKASSCGSGVSTAEYVCA